MHACAGRCNFRTTRECGLQRQEITHVRLRREWDCRFALLFESYRVIFEYQGSRRQNRRSIYPSLPDV